MAARTRRRNIGLGLAAVVFLAPRIGRAASPLYEITQDGGLGWSVASIGDLDGDLVPDFAAGAPDAPGPNSEGFAGEVRVFSGATGSPVGALVGLLRGDRNARLGRSLAAVGDVDGDGTPDIAAGATANGQYCEFSGGDPGDVVVFSGANGSVLRRIDGESQAECFGAALAVLGDIDGDRVRDLLVGARGATAEAPGQARVYSGADGAEIRRHVGERPTDNLGFSVTALRDVNGDGITDYAAGAPYRGFVDGIGFGGGMVVVFSGATGAEIARSTGETGLRLGIGVDAAGEPEGIARAELLVGTRPDAPLRDQIVALRLRGSQAEPVFQVIHPTESYGTYAKVVRSLGDLDGDGRADMVIGGDWGWAVLAGRRALPVLSASDGNTSETYGWLAPAGDVTGDGVGDLLVGNPEESWVRVYALDGASTPKSMRVTAKLRPGNGVKERGRLVVRVRGTNVSVKAKLTGFYPSYYYVHLETPTGKFLGEFSVKVEANHEGVGVVSQSRFLPQSWSVTSPFELSGAHIYVSGPGHILEGTLPDFP